MGRVVGYTAAVLTTEFKLTHAGGQMPPYAAVPLKNDCKKFI